MVAARIFLSLCAALCGAASVQAACPPLPTALRFDARAVQGPDCAFTGAAENDVDGYYKARPAQDLGHGQVGQRVMQSTAACGGETEALVLLDCQAGKALALAGLQAPAGGPKPEVVIGPAPNTYIKYIQPPHGPIALGLGTSLAEIEATARTQSIGRYPSLKALALSTRPRNQVDLWCGCKRFYPNSAGAGI